MCNGVIVFDDTGELLPDGQALAPHVETAPSVEPVRGLPLAARVTTTLVEPAAGLPETPPQRVAAALVCAAWLAMS